MQASCRIQADVVVVSSQVIHAPGQVVLRNGLVEEVTGRISDRPDVFLDGMALLPSLVNAHTHLEFSDLVAPLPAGASFVDWIRAVMARRREQITQAADGATQSNAAASACGKGLRESHGFGVGCVGDIVTPPWQPHVLQLLDAYALPSELAQLLTPASQLLLSRHMASSASLPKVQVFIEQLGLTAERAGQASAWAEGVCDRAHNDSPRRLRELSYSPHAPYSTCEELFHRTVATAKSRDAVVAMHIAESADERQWLDEGTGPMAEFLSSLGFDGPAPTAGHVARLMEAMSECSRSLIVHGNYLTLAELDQLARHRDRQSLVYCPRTHLHFGHKPYPLVEMQARGLRVVFGTDSRATNPDLNLWQEGRTALHLHRSLRPTAAFAAITESAAFAMRADNEFGTIAANKSASLCVVPLKTLQASMLDDNEKFFECLLEENLQPIALSSTALSE